MAAPRRLSPRRALLPCVLAASGIIGSILGLRAAFCTPFSAGHPSLRSSTARLTRHASEGKRPGDAYVAVLVEKPDGETVQVEAKPADQVRVLKAMIQLETGIDEESQELSLASESGDVRLDVDATLAESGIEEGAKLVLRVTEEQEESAVEVEVVPEGSVRIFIKCDVSPGKVKKVPLYVQPTDLVKDVKKRAHKEMEKAQPAFGNQPSSHYGLFKVEGEIMDGTGNLRYLRRDERWADHKTVADFSPQGDEELLFASLFWLE